MNALEGGFADASADASRAFRAVLEAMARPGRIEDVSGAAAPGLSVAASVMLLTLVDGTTPVYLAPPVDSPELRAWLAFHTGAPVCPRSEAVFALGTWETLAPLGDFSIGTSDYPDRSTTLIVEMEALTSSGATLTGPGIETVSQLSLPEIQAFRANRANFPLGLDFIFTSGTRLAALPRSTKVEG